MVVVCADDIFFLSKIRNTAKAFQLEIRAVTGPADEAVRKIADLQPRLILLDINSTRTNAVELIHTLKSSPSTARVSITGFVSHVNTVLREKAIEAGCDEVMARSVFADQLPQILSKAQS
jgi:DNA-binding NarL/FixJ family response regulator